MQNASKRLRYFVVFVDVHACAAHASMCSSGNYVEFRSLASQLLLEIRLNAAGSHGRLCSGHDSAVCTLKLRPYELCYTNSIYTSEHDFNILS